MPSKDGTLSPDEKNKVAEFLKQKWANGACPCGQNQWRPLNTMVGSLALGDTGVIQTKDKIIPFVPVMCGNCGNTVFLSASFVGIVMAVDA
jgi:hypothetical protein